MTWNYDVLLLDIEGTTTPISFVHDVLFPYAREAFSGFLREHQFREDVQVAIDAVLEQHKLDLEQGEDVPPLGESDSMEEFQRMLLRYLLWQMDHDKKTHGLKSLQGKIWKEGYAKGELKGEVFGEVAEVFAALKEQGKPIYIYSSGSVQAQVLLFGQTTVGDLLPYLSGHFDTETGGKKEAQSYVVIAEKIGVAPERILFATDILEEAVAANAAGVQAVMMERPGNHSQPSHSFPVLKDLRSLAE